MGLKLVVEMLKADRARLTELLFSLGNRMCHWGILGHRGVVNEAHQNEQV